MYTYYPLFQADIKHKPFSVLQAFKIYRSYAVFVYALYYSIAETVMVQSVTAFQRDIYGRLVALGFAVGLPTLYIFYRSIPVTKHLCKRFKLARSVLVLYQSVIAATSLNDALAVYLIGILTPDYFVIK